MKRRTFIERAAQIAAGLGLGGVAAAKAKAAPVLVAPVVSEAVTGSNSSVAYVDCTGRAIIPDLLERGIRKGYFQDYPLSYWEGWFSLTRPGTPFGRRVPHWQVHRGRPPKRRRL